MTKEHKDFVEGAIEEIMYDVHHSNFHEIQPQLEYLVKIIRDLESELKAGTHMLADMHNKKFDLEAEIKDKIDEIKRRDEGFYRVVEANKEIQIECERLRKKLHDIHDISDIIWEYDRKNNEEQKEQPDETKK